MVEPPELLDDPEQLGAARVLLRTILQSYLGSNALLRGIVLLVMFAIASTRPA